jgi:hypothetical protein
MLATGNKNSFLALLGLRLPTNGNVPEVGTKLEIIAWLCALIWIGAIVCVFGQFMNSSTDSDPDEQNTYNLFASFTNLLIILQLWTVLYIFTHWSPLNKDDLNITDIAMRIANIENRVL